MRKMNDAVFYVEMSRPKRGYYTATYKLITRNPNSLPEHGITVTSLRCWKKPSARIHLVLWTHNRWKRTKEEFDKRYEVVRGKLCQENRGCSKRLEFILIIERVTR